MLGCSRFSKITRLEVGFGNHVKMHMNDNDDKNDDGNGDGNDDGNDGDNDDDNENHRNMLNDNCNHSIEEDNDTCGFNKIQELGVPLPTGGCHLA